MADFVTFKGRKYRLCLPGPYYRAEGWGKGASSLHRAKWEHYRGAIPPGCHVHHKDGDGANNLLSNLELVDGREHNRQHSSKMHELGILKPPGDLARERAAEWHASPEGLAWHSENGKRAWDNRVWHQLKCQQCGRGYTSPYPNKSKFCHLNCRQAALRRRRKALT